MLKRNFMFFLMLAFGWSSIGRSAAGPISCNMAHSTERSLGKEKTSLRLKDIKADTSLLAQASPALRNQMIESIRLNFNESGLAPELERLLDVGVPSKEVGEMARPFAEQRLEELEMKKKPGSQPAKQLTHKPTLSISGPVVLPQETSLKSFSEHFGLNPSMEFIGEIFDFSPHDNSLANSAVNLALLTGDPQLMRRALTQAARFDLHAKIVDFAALIHNDQLLMDTAEMGLVRYLYSKRSSHILLHVILRALDEIRGPLADRAQEMLRGLSDLMMSGAILENASQVKYNFPYDGSSPYFPKIPPLDQRLQDTLRVLKTEFQSARRQGRLDRIRVEKLYSFLQEIRKYQVNPGSIAEAAISMEDFQLISQIAKDYFKSRHDIPSDIKDPRSREIYTRDHMTIAFNLLLAIGDAVEFKNMMTALAADPLVDADHFIDPFHSLAPQIAEPMLFISKANADNLRPIGLEAIRNSRPNLRQKYVDFFRGLNQFFKETGNDVVVQSESQMGGQREDPFKPEQERVAEALKYGQGSSPKKLQAFRDKGQELLARGVYWDACFMFTAARDIKGLRQLYQVIVTTQGAPKRYLSYVTAAMIMIGAEE